MSEPITPFEVLTVLFVVIAVCYFLIAFSSKGRR